MWLGFIHLEHLGIISSFRLLSGRCGFCGSLSDLRFLVYIGSFISVVHIVSLIVPEAEEIQSSDTRQS